MSRTEVSYAIAVERRVYVDVGIVAVVVIFLPVGSRNQPVEYSAYPQFVFQRELLRLVFVLLQVDGNNHVGPHLPHNVNGQVV